MSLAVMMHFPHFSNLKYKIRLH